jgi:hypothetical protein
MAVKGGQLKKGNNRMSDQNGGQGLDLTAVGVQGADYSTTGLRVAAFRHEAISIGGKPVEGVALVNGYNPGLLVVGPPLGEEINSNSCDVWRTMSLPVRAPRDVLDAAATKQGFGDFGDAKRGKIDAARAILRETLPIVGKMNHTDPLIVRCPECLAENQLWWQTGIQPCPSCKAQLRFVLGDYKPGAKDRSIPFRKASDVIGYPKLVLPGGSAGRRQTQVIIAEHESSGLLAAMRSLSNHGGLPDKRPDGAAIMPKLAAMFLSAPSDHPTKGWMTEFQGQADAWVAAQAAIGNTQPQVFARPMTDLRLRNVDGELFPLTGDLLKNEGIFVEYVRTWRVGLFDYDRLFVPDDPASIVTAGEWILEWFDRSNMRPNQAHQTGQAFIM